MLTPSDYLYLQTTNKFHNIKVPIWERGLDISKLQKKKSCNVCMWKLLMFKMNRDIYAHELDLHKGKLNIQKICCFFSSYFS